MWLDIVRFALYLLANDEDEVRVRLLIALVYGEVEHIEGLRYSEPSGWDSVTHV